MTELSFIQKLRLKIFGYVPVGTRIKEGWKAPIKHYAFKCPKHEIVVNYPHGFKQRLSGPKCQEERKAGRTS